MRAYSSCGECPFFKNEDSDGNGWCQLRDLPNSCDAWCYFLQGENDVDEKQAERILHYHQKWRRHNGKKHMKMVNGTLLGQSLDVAIRVLRKEIDNQSKQKKKNENGKITASGSTSEKIFTI